MTAPHWTKKLVVMRACAPSVTWARDYPSLEVAWAACEQPEWMLWLLGRTVGSRQDLVLASCACVRMALPYVGASEGRIRAAIELVESWCRGDVALEHVRAAYAAFNDEYYVYAIYSAVFAVHDYEAITYASASAAAAAYAPYGSAFRRAACDAIRRVVHCPKLQEQP